MRLTAGDPRTILAPCKVNLGLQILRKRDDGYHDIVSVLLHVPWHDVVAAQPAHIHHFTCSDPLLPTDESNLCVRARLAFESVFGSSAGVHLHLDKRVPYGAGLGSGSSDAAAVLLLLADLAGIDRSDERLFRAAASVGSDVPFFLQDRPALVTGRGDVLTPVEYEFPFALVIVTPDVSISTADAYVGVRPREVPAGPTSTEAGSALLATVRTNDLALWRDELVNDFEPFVFSTFPQLERLKGSLYGLGAGYAALSGSGSAVFGVFKNEGGARGAAEALSARGLRGWWGDAAGRNAWGARRD